MLNLTLWVLQALLAVAFLAHGVFFLIPPAGMSAQLNAAIAPAFRIFIGVAELLAAVGLILPGVTRVWPGLVAAAAVGLAIVMVGATAFHISRGETSSAVTTAVLLALSVFVAYMRWKVQPIPPRVSRSAALNASV